MNATLETNDRLFSKQDEKRDKRAGHRQTTINCIDVSYSLRDLDDIRFDCVLIPQHHSTSVGRQPKIDCNVVKQQGDSCSWVIEECYWSHSPRHHRIVGNREIFSKYIPIYSRAIEPKKYLPARLRDYLKESLFSRQNSERS